MFRLWFSWGFAYFDEITALDYGEDEIDPADVMVKRHKKRKVKRRR